MGSKTRLIAKSATWQGMGLVSMTLIGYVFTGSVSAGGGIAVAGSLTGFFTYMLHEAVWARFGDRRVRSTEP